MRKSIPVRRGSCGLQILAALAILAVILLIVGVVGFIVSGPSSAASQFEAQLKKFTESATVFEAPGSKEIEFKAGGGVVMLSPEGMVGDKRIGTPPSSVTLDVKIESADGKALKFERNTAPRNPAAPFELIGFFKVDADGTYTVTVTPSDGSTPAAILVGAGTEQEVASLLSSVAALLTATVSGCVGICGLVGVMAFGIPALVMWRSKRRQQQEQRDPFGGAA